MSRRGAGSGCAGWTVRRALVLRLAGPAGRARPPTPAAEPSQTPVLRSALTTSHTSPFLMVFFSLACRCLNGKAHVSGGWGKPRLHNHEQRPTLLRTAAAAAAAAYQDPSPAMTAGGALGSRAGQQPSAYYHAPMRPSSSAHPVVQLVELVDGAVKLVLPAVGVKVLIALPLAHGALDVAAACGQAGQGGSRTTGQKRAAGGDARAG